MSEHQNHRLLPFAGQHLPNVRTLLTGIAHYEIPAIVPVTTMRAPKFADSGPSLSNYKRYRVWDIEEIFRSLKSDGMRLEETQLHDASRLFKLALVGLAAATRTVQLVDARDGSPRPATDVIDATLIPAAEAIAPTLEGKTRRQQNPYPPHSLAWLSWIVARLGGWNSHYKPPGPKNHACRMGAFRLNGRRLRPRYPIKCVNPVALVAPAGVVGAKDGERTRK